MARWSQEEELLLAELYPDTDNRTISQKLGRTMNSVECKASRMGLSKNRENSEEEGDSSPNPLRMITRKEARALDKIELLRLIWSLAKMYERELTAPGLSKAERHKLMNALSNHTSIVNNIMKGADDLLREEEEDLEAKFVEIIGQTPSRVRARKVIIDLGREHLVLER